MEKNRPTVIAVCDAGPLIHLDELDCLPLLTDFRVWVPEAVWSEVWRHRPPVFQQSVVPFERHVNGQAERPAAQPDKLPPVQLPALPELRPVRSDGIHRKERKGRKE